jgi:hypothetical protein
VKGPTRVDGESHTLNATKPENVRLFMIPGMGHCGGGDAPSVFDAIQTIDDWVQTGRPPARIIASSPPNAPPRTRLLCPFPQEAVYSGTGNTDDEKSFHCAAGRSR